jgi:hypothetical protein
MLTHIKLISHGPPWKSATINKLDGACPVFDTQRWAALSTKPGSRALERRMSTGAHAVFAKLRVFHGEGKT